MKRKTLFAGWDTARQAIANALAGCSRLLHERTILVLTIMFCVGVVCMLWYVSHLQSNLIASTVLQDASLYSQALGEFRTLYTSEVVETVIKHGIEVTHDHTTKEGAIPLPVTLTMLLGKRIAAHGSGAQTRLYSPYPFPSRQEEGGLPDAFSQEAWSYLQQNPGKSFYRFEDFKGLRSLRYATADLMRPSCVNCHNMHPASPKTDWKTGDVRGILEVILPLDRAVAQTYVGLKGTFALMAVMSVLWLSGLALVIGRLRQSSADLTQRASALENEISERKGAEEALRQSQQQYHHLLESTHDLIQSVSPDGCFLFVNQAWLKTLGYTEAQLRQLRIADIVHPRSLSHWRGVCARVLAGESVQYLQATLLAQDGRSILVEGNMIGRYVDDEAVALHGFFRDITERVRLQEQLIERERLAALGRITGAIAHELGTPLNSVLGYTQLLANAELPEDARRRLKIIESQVQRMAEIITHYLSRTRGAPPTHRPVNLNELVLETLVQLEIRFQQSHVQAVTTLSESLPLLDADGASLQRLMINLLNNAIDAMPAGGTVTVTTRLTVPPESPRRGIVVEVADTGTGIPAELLPKVFNLFVTTKSEARGTGLGLAICQEIVRSHGGTIQLSSQVGEGTCVRVFLPTEEPDQ
jgi:PAS domain S-box-containing protein